MGTFFAGIASWLLSRASQKWIGTIIQKLASTDAGQVRLAQIEADAKVALKHEDTAQLVAMLGAKTALQQSKMNWPIFWIIICVMMAPPAMMFISVGLYNIFWWEHGIWPQTWSIAEFPPSVKPWADKAIDWLYDPVGQATGIGTALVAGRLTRK